MRTRRSYVATAIAIGAITLSGCAADVSGREDGLPASGDFGDVEDLSTVFQNIDAADVTSTFSETSGLLAVELADGKNVLVVKRAVDSAILVNGATVSDSGKLATMTNVKKITVVTATPGGDTDEKAIFDFLGGTFATGTSGGIGVDVDLGGATPGSDADEVSIRGTSAKDAWYIGTAGELSLGNDDLTDAKFTGVESLVLALAAGDDTFSATNVNALGADVTIKGVTGTSSVAVTVYGGAGKDVITGGSGADFLWGGLDNDTLDGAGGLDTLDGEDGADTFNMGAADDSAVDVLTCGTGVDLVSYALRTATVVAKVGVSTGFTVQDTLNDDCDNLTGGAGDDHLFGGTTTNVISGGAGDDVLSGGAGNDTLNGDLGNDTFVEGILAGAIPMGAGEDLFNGHAGADTIHYGLYALVASVSPAVTARTAPLTVTMDGSAANDGETGEKDNIKADVENIVVGHGGGTYSGNLGNNVFFQPAKGTAGDVMTGLAGFDTVDYSARTALNIIATMGDDTANDGETGELDNIKSDIENLISSTGVDNITGNDLDNFLDLGAGAAQTAVCGNGDDIVVGLTVTTYTGCEIYE